MSALLVRHLVESTLLCLLLGAITSSLRRQRAAARHTLWLIGISKFLIPTFLFTATGAQLAFLLPSTAWISFLAARASALLVALFGNWPSHIFTDAIAASHPLLMIWLLGSVLMLGAWLIRLRRSRYPLVPAGPAEKQALQHTRRMIGYTAGLEIGLSSPSNEPSLIGMFHPTVTIPQGLCERLSRTECEAMLLHELAHASRRDNLSSAFVHAVVCIFWFHPLLWFAEKQLATERERACDEAVIRCGVNPRTYLAALAKVCRFHLAPDVAGISAASGSDLSDRFDRILSCRSNEPVPHVIRFLLAGLAICLTLLPIAGGYCEQCGANLQNTPRQEQSK